MAKSDLMKAYDRMTREERQAARAVRDDAADEMGMRRFEFMRAVNRGDQDALGVLKLSAIEMYPRWEFDQENFQAFLDMIIKFIQALMQIFSMFGGI